ncbi:hypothetical protein MPTK1_4g20890 [Marchantia polymorpha subsp. ruderalis]|uniref:Uncharacterized protein n=2 Tax=Marchantia polymorpha TaxID=3197 RepID=A0AAF6BC51_MARPO|nr:hypothetical protein MARPO_0101s0035 [Marchantia polymorpha]BBN09585.1 hypothetical protein Mp_4g20890 [Marchantia polymorpha subsp. ruderalis]|eukprot:PTQ32243.1 hypothetical protein MARPO_0101s0035 [Marchantia polymorpha]
MERRSRERNDGGERAAAAMREVTWRSSIGQVRPLDCSAVASPGRSQSLAWRISRRGSFGLHRAAKFCCASFVRCILVEIQGMGTRRSNSSAASDLRYRCRNQNLDGLRTNGSEASFQNGHSKSGMYCELSYLPLVSRFVKRSAHSCWCSLAHFKRQSSMDDLSATEGPVACYFRCHFLDELRIRVGILRG